MTFSRIATVLAAASVLAIPAVASADTRASVSAPKYSLASLRRSASVKRTNGALEGAGLLLLIPATAAIVVAGVEVTKSGGA